MRGQTNTLLYTSIALVMLTLAGCGGRTSRGGRRGAAADPWTHYAEAVEGEMIMAGTRFEDSREAVPDVSFENVLFGFDSFQVPRAEQHKVEEVASYLKANPEIVVVIEGHCDERGSREYNLSLGEQRALAVRAYLINLGIAPERVQTVSYGKERPLDPGHNEAAWRLNRRGEFVFYR